MRCLPWALPMTDRAPAPRKPRRKAAAAAIATRAARDAIPPMALPQLIVGIGASAGGLDAFRSFFAHTPADSGCSFVLVQHL